MNDAVGVVRRERVKLLTSISGLQVDLVGLYQGTEKDILILLDIIASRIEAKGKSNISAHELLRQIQLEALLAQTRREINKVAPKAVDKVMKGKVQAIDGAVATTEKIGAEVGVRFNRLNTETLKQFAYLSKQGSPLADLFTSLGDDVSNVIRQTIFNGIAQKSNPRVVASKLAKTVQVLSKWDAEVIARTEMMRANRQTTIENYRYNSSVISGWRWMSNKSLRTCALCLGQDGKVRKLKEAFNSHPACRCTCVPVIVGRDDVDYGILGQDFFDQQDEAGKLEILGGSKTLRHLLTHTDLKLADISAYEPSKFGPTLSQVPLRKLVLQGKITMNQLTEARGGKFLAPHASKLD